MNLLFMLHHISCFQSEFAKPVLNEFSNIPRCMQYLSKVYCDLIYHIIDAVRSYRPALIRLQDTSQHRHLCVQ